MNTDFPCTLDWIFLDLPHQLWELQTGDTDAIVLITRILHNKPSLLFTNLIRCYTSFFSPDFLTASFTFFGMALFFIGIWYLLQTKKRQVLLLILLLAPLFPLLGIPDNKHYQGVLLYGLEACVIIFGVTQVFLWLRQKFFSS